MEVKLLLYWFKKVCVTTANASALHAMAEIFERGDYVALREFFVEHDGRVEFLKKSQNRAGNARTIVMPEELYPMMAQRLRDLATGEEHAYFCLSELDGSLADYSPNDWRILRVECRPEPPYDYTPDVQGTEWDAIIFYDGSDAELFVAAWSEIVEWSWVLDGDKPDKLTVEIFGQEPTVETHPPRDAFELLVSGRGLTPGPASPRIPYQVSGYPLVPFRQRNNQALDWIQVYFDHDRVWIIAADDHAETGSVDLDLENFRSCPGAWCKSVALYAAPGG